MDGRRVRPLVWAAGGVVAVLIGVGLATSAVSAATQIGDVSGLRACTNAFADGCTTRRAAVLEVSGHVRLAWLTQEQEWFARVPAGAPGLKDGDRLKIMVPRQDGAGQLHQGARVDLIYYGRSAAWIQLPSGQALQTEDHPRRAAPMRAWMALACLGGGIFGLQTGIRSRRREGAWWRRVPAHIAYGIPGLAFPAGCFGFIGQVAAGGTIWPGVAGALLGTGLGMYGWRRVVSREAEPDDQAR
jgi:hypothetical protein